MCQPASRGECPAGPFGVRTLSAIWYPYDSVPWRRDPVSLSIFVLYSNLQTNKSLKWLGFLQKTNTLLLAHQLGVGNWDLLEPQSKRSHQTKVSTGVFVQRGKGFLNQLNPSVPFWEVVFQFWRIPISSEIVLSVKFHLHFISVPLLFESPPYSILFKLTSIDMGWYRSPSWIQMISICSESVHVDIWISPGYTLDIPSISIS